MEELGTEVWAGLLYSQTPRISPPSPKPEKQGEGMCYWSPARAGTREEPPDRSCS